MQIKLSGPEIFIWYYFRKHWHLSLLFTTFFFLIIFFQCWWWVFGQEGNLSHAVFATYFYSCKYYLVTFWIKYWLLNRWIFQHAFLAANEKNAYFVVLLYYILVIFCCCLNHWIIMRKISLFYYFFIKVHTA